MVNNTENQQRTSRQSLSIAIRLENALAEKNSIDSLRQVVIELNQSGLNKEEIYQEFLAYHTFLEAQHRNQEVDILGEVMDMMTGWYVGQELDLK